jgi:RimJ/RimL family protein N-acetyltransferase
MLARFGFEDLGLQRIEITAAVGNVASQRVAEKIGAVREGLLRNRFLLQGRSHDAYLYSLIPEDTSQP